MEELILDVLTFINEKMCKSGEVCRAFCYSDKEHTEDERRDYHIASGENAACVEIMDFVIKRYRMAQLDHTTERVESQGPDDRVDELIK